MIYWPSYQFWGIYIEDECIANLCSIEQGEALTHKHLQMVVKGIVVVSGVEQEIKILRPHVFNLRDLYFVIFVQ